VTCARCHDHKYDSIPTQDYYSLYGVFASTHEPDPLPIVGLPDPAAFSDYQSQKEKIQAERTELIRKKEAELLQRYRRLTADFLLASRQAATQATAEKPETSFADTSVLRAGERRWRKALEKLSAESDPIFAPWFAFAALPEGEFAERAKELAAKVTGNGLPQPINPLVAQAFAGEPPASLAAVAKRYARLFEQIVPIPGEATDVTSQPGDSSTMAAREALRKFLLENDAPGTLPENALRKLFPPMLNMQLQQFGSQLDQLDLQHPGSPRRAMVLYDNPQPQNARVFIRGNPNNPGPEVPRQFLEVLSGPNRRPFSQGSGRLELARAIASPNNPLTARVIVNRVWLHHFGRGLVPSPDDFGVRADPPSHPQLLDWLASRFMDEGWSIKKLHRWLLLTRVYQQSSDLGQPAATTDPDNRLYSRMNRRRLDFESLRDTLLYVAGNLDSTVGGRAVALVPQPRVAAGGNFIAEAGDVPPTTRRAVYGFIDRQNLPGLLRSFDFADPDTITGQRFATTVPQQALFFFNSPFVMRQACQLVAQTAAIQPDGGEQQVRELYQRVLQRNPSNDEVDLARRFLATEQAAGSTTDIRPPESNPANDLRPLTPCERLAHVLLMSDELMFVD
ncbi:MAG: DUF1553 domain-containing protein, partial [Planctomycetes bacterium]|nr:DUF1553 domain-containing protein [Planctomycetota bacterium]